MVRKTQRKQEESSNYQMTQITNPLSQPNSMFSKLKCQIVNLFQSKSRYLKQKWKTFNFYQLNSKCLERKWRIVSLLQSNKRD